jgi:hypothetical protein
MIKLGWMPDVSKFTSDGTCRGNLMDILVFNSEIIIKSANLCESDEIESINWFEDYSNHFGVIENYPSNVIAFVVFNFLFKTNNTHLCLHQFEGRRENTYLDETIFIISEGVNAYLPLSAVNLDMDKKKIHLWNCDTSEVQHFEPAILQSEQQKVSINAKDWTTNTKQMMINFGIISNKRQRI